VKNNVKLHFTFENIKILQINTEIKINCFGEKQLIFIFHGAFKFLKVETGIVLL